jgi:hypothetical protein
VWSHTFTQPFFVTRKGKMKLQDLAQMEADLLKVVDGYAKDKEATVAERVGVLEVVKSQTIEAGVLGATGPGDVESNLQIEDEEIGNNA